MITHTVTKLFIGLLVLIGFYNPINAAPLSTANSLLSAANQNLAPLYSIMKNGRESIRFTQVVEGTVNENDLNSFEYCNSTSLATFSEKVRSGDSSVLVSTTLIDQGNDWSQIALIGHNSIAVIYNCKDMRSGVKAIFFLARFTKS